MRRSGKCLFVVLLLANCTRAAASDLTAIITGGDGKPLPNAVVSVMGSGLVPPPYANPADRTIDQRGETFVPLVTILPKGGRVTFSNSDPKTHQVYSFSRIKQFELTLGRGEAKSIAFDNAGVAALGCNIHDNMIAYVFVTESSYVSLTGEDGAAVIKNIPPGKYRAEVWHPQQRPGSAPPSVELEISGEATRWEASLKVLPPRKTRSHGGNY